MKENVRKEIKIILKSLLYLPIIFLTICSCASFINTNSFPFAILITLSFPIWLILSLLTVVFSFTNRTRLYTYVIGLLINSPNIYKFCPINIENNPNKDDLTIVSYNVRGFNSRSTTDTTYYKKYAEVFKIINADIILFQEGSTIYFSNLKKIIYDKYKYQINAKPPKIQHSILGAFSKYPIIDYKIIDTTSTNTCAVFHINLPQNDTLTILNCHFVSNRFKEGESTISQLMKAANLRGIQVDKIADYIDNHKSDKIILVGDFNDIPISYTYRKLSNRLKDCFVACGNGFGRTYYNTVFPLRIDNIFCDEHWTPTFCDVKEQIKLSDHYPIVATLKRNK